MGRTPDGRLFHVQDTPDMLSSIFRPDLPKTPLDLVTLFSLALQLVLFCTLSRAQAQTFFMVYFGFWRLSYNLGLGYLLTQQSQTRWLVRLVDRHGWMDAKRAPKTCAWVRQQLVTKMGKQYKFEEMPLEYNTWLLFRSVVDVILLNDFTAYFLFGVSHMHGTRGLGVFLFILRWVAGLILIVFNIWVKLDAHRVVKDYAWYWGDCFFLCLQNLVFDGVYEVAPDPMYSIGYAGYYGLSLLSGSYTVVFVSLAAHACQWLFLIWFENPHIERVYGEKQPIAARVSQKKQDAQGTESTTSEPNPHDLHHRLFRNDPVVLSNLDLMRGPDFLLVVAVLYACTPLVFYRAGPLTMLVLLCVNAVGWRVFHSFGLGTALMAQSKTKWIVRHFVKCYHFTNAHDALYDVFAQWKTIYNASLVMVYVSFAALAVQCYAVPTASWVHGTTLLRHVLGALLILLHAWSARSSFRVLGPFGWLYGDFFIADYPRQLFYTGIYRFLNNPERSMGGAAFFGMALISGSPLVACVALFSQLSHWWFLSYVESPHMRRLYGEQVRQDSGVTKQMKQIARKNAFLFHNASQNPTLREVQETLHRTQAQAKQVVEQLLSQSRPNVERLVDDTYALLLEQSDKLLRLRTGNEMRTLDRTKYSILAAESPNTHAQRYHLGEAIFVRWTAPSNHSRRDWIGMYPVDAVKGESATRFDAGLLHTHVSSRGKWVGLAEQEWDGDQHSGTEQGPLGTKGVSDVNQALDQVEGISVFRGKQLPWRTGRYTLRYHHDATHNVLAQSAPFDIYADAPHDPLSFSETYASLSKIVRFALADTPEELASSVHSEDPDDLTFWSHTQVEHIANGVRDAFHVEFSPEVIMADANTAQLARNIVVARQLMQNEHRTL